MKLKNPFTIIRIGLVLIFLANALLAFFSPQEFKDLVEASFLVKLFPMVSSSVLVMMIGVNDSLVTLALLLNIKKLKTVLIRACIWLLGVMAVIMQPINILEHLGILSMALALLVNLKQGGTSS